MVFVIVGIEALYSAGAKVGFKRILHEQILRFPSITILSSFSMLTIGNSPGISPPYEEMDLAKSITFSFLIRYSIIEFWSLLASPINLGFCESNNRSVSFILLD